MRGKKISRYNRLAAVAAAYASHSEATTRWAGVHASHSETRLQMARQANLWHIRVYGKLVELASEPEDPFSREAQPRSLRDGPVERGPFLRGCRGSRLFAYLRVLHLRLSAKALNRLED